MVEGYYDIAVVKHVCSQLDVQIVGNPAYKSRPWSGAGLGARLHAQF